MNKLNNFYSNIIKLGTIQRQSIVTFGWQFIITFIGLFSTIYIVHVAGTNILGGYFILLAYLGIIGIIADGGFGGAAIKRISEGEEQDAYFSAFLALRSIYVTVIIIALITFRSYFVDLNSAGTFYWLLIIVIVHIVQGTVTIGIIGCGKLGISSTAGFINNIVRIIIQIIAVFLGYGFAGLSGGFIIGMIVGFIIQLRFFDLHVVHFKWKHIKSLLSFSMWVFLISSGVTIFSTSDTIMIGYYLNNENVSVYRIVLQFTTLASFASIALLSTLYPKISRWEKTGEINLIEKSFSNTFAYSFILVIPMFAGAILLGDKLLYYLFGAEVEKGYITLLILFIVQIVTIFTSFFASYLSAMEHMKSIFKITMVAVVVNIALNILLIPIIGINGAAVATLITMGLNGTLALWVLSKIITVNIPFDNLLNILKATVVMSLFVGVYEIFAPLSNWLILIPVILGAIVYTISLLKFDSTMFKELNGIMIQMNIVYPKWLQ